MAQSLSRFLAVGWWCDWIVFASGNQCWNVAHYWLFLSVRRLAYFPELADVVFLLLVFLAKDFGEMRFDPLLRLGNALSRQKRPILVALIRVEEPLAERIVKDQFAVQVCQIKVLMRFNLIDDAWNHRDDRSGIERGKDPTDQVVACECD